MWLVSSFISCWASTLADRDRRSVILFLIHAWGWKKCDAVLGHNTHTTPIMTPFFGHLADAKLAVAVCACFLLSFTVNIVTEFLNLSNPNAPRFRRDIPAQ